MMLTFDEYMDLKKLLDSSKESEGSRLEETLVKPKKRKSTRYQKALSKAMQQANELQRKKNGQYKKGKSARTVLKAAHKAAKKMMK